MSPLDLVHAMDANGGPSWLRDSKFAAPHTIQPMYQRRRAGAEQEPMSEDREMTAMLRTVHNRRGGKADPGTSEQMPQNTVLAAVGGFVACGIIAGCTMFFLALAGVVAWG